LLAGLLPVTGSALLARYWIPTAIVYAPNFGKPAGRLNETHSAQLSVWGISQQFQLDVGPPFARLSVWLMEPQGPVRGTVVVLHGIRDSKASMLGMGRLLAAGGYRPVLVDLRGHGQSSGDWLTYGVLDSQDLSQVLDALHHRDLLAEPVGVFGCSYGAATAIQFAAHDPRVRSVVAVAPFATLHGAVHSYARLFGMAFILPRATIDRAVEDAGEIGHFLPSEASPLRAIGQTSARVLLIHGEADWKIPLRSSQQLHAAAPNRSRLIVLKGAGHDSIMRAVRKTSMASILAWFDTPSEN